MAAVGEAAEYVSRTGSESLVLLGVEPTDPEADYGWLSPGLPEAPTRHASLRRISDFIEKPRAAQAAELMAKGWLWNTMVIVARAETLWKLVRQVAPELTAYFSMIRRAIGSLWESEIINEVYRMMSPVNFSTAILTRCSERLLVLPVRKVLWSDWGRGERILATLAQIGIPEPVLARAGAAADYTLLGGAKR
jgi:mannose-1-phosphate guanylyltransferase